MEQEIIKFLNKTFVLCVVLVAGILIFLLAVIGYQQQVVSQQNQNQITVSGEGKVYAKPDVATISFGVTTQASTVASVTANNTTKMNAVIAAIKKLGVVDKDIQTTNYNLSPVYSTSRVIVPMPAGTYNLSSPSISSESQTITGYSLEQDVTVKIRDFTKIGDIMTATTASGANLVGSLQFTIDNPDQYKNQAEASAIAAAKVNANSLVKASGIQLGKIINVQENNLFYPTVYNSMAKLGGGVAESAPSPTIQPGQQEIDETVNVTYQVK